MNGLVPVVRYLIVCEEVVIDPTNRNRVSLIGLVSSIASRAQPPFPVAQPRMCVFVQLTDCRRPAEGRIVHADTNQTVYRSPTYSLPLSIDPLEIQGMTIRIGQCVFPRSGLYEVHFWYNTTLLAQQAVRVR